MKRTYRVSDMLACTYWCPGSTLDDISLKRLHHNILTVNENSNANIKHRMLVRGTSIEELRNIFAHSVVAEFFMEGKPTAFLISPILENSGKPILHSGLMIIEKNPGGNLMTFLFLINATLAYKKMGPFYVTNISSTPSAIENFLKIIPKAWPGPDVNLRKSPRGYDQILKILKTDYLDINFPDADMIKIDYKRFIMKSNSSEMGFKTNFHKVSKAEKLKYNLFCHTWINYEDEEDVIQIGDIRFFKYLKFKMLLLKYQFDLSLVRGQVMKNRHRSEEQLKKENVHPVANKKAS